MTGLHLVTIALFTATVGVAWRFMARVAGPPAGMLTVLLLLAYPVLFFTGTTLYAQTFGAFLFLLGLLLIAGPEPRSAGSYLVTGLLYGWLVLAIPMFLPSVLVVALWRLRPISRLRIVRVTALLAMVGVIAGLWIARNFAQTGRFIFIASDAEAAFLAGIFAVASPSDGGNNNRSGIEAAASRLSETDRPRYYRQQALRWLPHTLARRLIVRPKVAYWFSPTNRLAQADQQTAVRDLIMVLTYCPLLLLFVVRLLQFRRYPLQSWEFLFYLLYVQGALCHAVFFPRIRYRLPYDYLLISVVAGYVWTVLNPLVEMACHGLGTASEPRVSVTLRPPFLGAAGGTTRAGRSAGVGWVQGDADADAGLRGCVMSTRPTPTYRDGRRESR